MSTAPLDLDPSIESRIRQLAALDSDVLITGPTGSGKSTVARRIHDLSGRSGRFMPQNCAAIPGDLAEGILFGHERGAFTGADQRRTGILVEADKGTLFLDEIGELSLPMQAKLLNVLQDREVWPLGAKTAQPARFRLISATNRDLVELCNQGLFREDLYHRINGLPLKLSHLRDSLERAERIAVDQAKRIGLEPERIAPLRLAVKRLTIHPEAWPGNIRELISFVQLCQLDVDEAESSKYREWTRWQNPAGPERLTPFAPSVSPSLADRERFAGLIRELVGGGRRPKAAFSQKGSMEIASRLLDAYPTPVSTGDLESTVGTRDLRTIRKTIAALVEHGLAERTDGGIVAVWPPARSSLVMYRQAEWVPVGPGEIPALTRGDRLRIEVTSRCAGVLGVAMITHPPNGSPMMGTLVKERAISASKPIRVETELDASEGIEQILVHIGPARHRGGQLIAVSQVEDAVTDFAALELGRRWVLGQWKEGWLQEHLVFHAQSR